MGHVAGSSMLMLVLAFSASKDNVSRSDSMSHYYVATKGTDSNDGSASRPWATIQHASAVIGPGATVHVAAGIYNLGTITTTTSGTASARIHYVSDTQWGAKIVGSGDTVWYNSGNYVDIRGFDITGSNRATRLGINSEASHVRILNNHVHGIQATGGGNRGGAGISTGWTPGAGYTGTDNDVIGNVVHDIAFATAGHQVHGIYYSGPGGHILNNLVYGCQAWGIHLWHQATGITIANNTVFENGYGGITVGGDSTTGVVDDHTIVSNNIVYHTVRGIYEWDSTGLHNRYLNNLVSGSSSFTIRLNHGLTPRGGIASSPQFVNYVSSGTGDPTWYRSHFQLAAGTNPAVDTGTSEGAPGNDIDGGARPFQKRHDLGAYERGAPPAAWPW